MATEIERKFKVKSSFKQYAFSSSRITQGYLCTEKERTVRIRIRGKKGFITIKGKSNSSGLSRFEWEKEIPLAEAEDLIKLCGNKIIDKTRYLIKSDNHLFEVDEFYGNLSGLLLAEVELSTENESVTLPEFIGEEVTGDARYYNSNLINSSFPF